MLGLVPLQEEEETRARSRAHSKKVTLCKPGRGASPDTKSGSILILNSHLPERWEINVCWLNHPVSGILLQQHEQTEAEGKG